MTGDNFRKPPSPTKSKGYASQLSSVLHKWVQPAFKRRGFVEHRIITHWPEIIGHTLVLYCAPKRVFFSSKEKVDGTLVVEVFNSALATELQHMEPTIIDKIASYFGYNAVSRIKIIQNIKATETLSSPRLNTPKVSKKRMELLEEQTSNISDPELKKRLMSLGQLISKNT